MNVREIQTGSEEEEEASADFFQGSAIPNFVSAVRSSLDSRSDRHGFLDDNPNFHSSGLRCLYHGQIVLQQRPFCQSAPLNIGYYCNSLLLDDVGYCISGTA
ncbi:hypothetical protein AAC387_Pa11g0271 [Persea americana]